MYDLKKLKSMSLLYVEDDPLVLKESLEIFQVYFGEVSVFDNGKGASIALGAKEFDIMIFDIRLPGVNGIELSAQAKRQNSNAKIIITSSYEETGDLKEFIKIGVVSYLTKPFSLQELQEALYLCLEPKTSHKNPLVRFGEEMVYDVENLELKKSQEIIPLSRNERIFLEFVLTSDKNTLSYEDICQNVYGWENPENSLSAIRNLVYRLNKKLGYRIFEGIDGFGYKVIL